MVSIVIPVHNAENFIGDTIRSCMAQSFRDWELLLVNDHSEDASEEIMRSLIEECHDRGLTNDIRILQVEEGHGAAIARNTGIRAAKGRFIAFLDADDVWEPEKLEEQMGFIEDNKAAFSFTGYEFADETGIGIDKIVHVPERMTYSQALKNTTIFTSTVIFDTSILDKKLIEMPDVPSEDTATWWKVLKSGYTAYGLDRPLTLYRRSGNTLSSDKGKAIRRIWNLYRNVEKLSPMKSAWCFLHYAVHATARRI